MQAHNNNVEEFLGTQRTIFVVPVYQRNYDWKETHCKQLFRDILNVITLGHEHFLGTICFKNTSSRERSIIDGQQRLTSISLLLKALYDLVDNDEYRDEIATYLYNKGHSVDNDYLRVKLHLNKKDDHIYRILLDNDSSTIKNKLTHQEKESRIYQNYLFFCGAEQDFLKHGGKVDELLESLRNLTIIELEVQKENPQEIFESLNSTGLDLSNVDLLRNYFLMQFGHDQQSELYENYWSKMEDLINPEHMENFFVDYLIYKRKSNAISIGGRKQQLTAKYLYYSFEDYYNTQIGGENFEGTVELFEDLRTAALSYHDFIFQSNTDLNTETPLRKKLYFLLEVLESKNARCLLLYIFMIYKKKFISENVLVECVDALTSFAFRAKMCKANGINRQFSGNVMLRLSEVKDYSDFINIFWDVITFGKGSYAFPTDAEFENALINKDLYLTLRSKGTKYLLYVLETSSPYHKGIPSFMDDTIQIEHIMPQKLTSDWFNSMSKEDLERHEMFLHKLGNLTLTNYNSEMSNKSFEDKRKVYLQSNFYYTRMLAAESSWTIEKIILRSHELAKSALQIWNLPDKYQKDRKIESLHDLNEDFQQFTFTKPTAFMLGNEEYSVTTWKAISNIVFEQLREINPEVLEQIASPKNDRVYMYAPDESYASNTTYLHVVGNIYTLSSKSAVSTLSMISRILKSFDEETGMDLFNSVLYAVKSSTGL